MPRHIEKWFDGAEGERWTERQVRPLQKAGWHIAHDLDGLYGNVDHIAVGPGGVFLIDSKNWGGIVAIENGVPCVTPPDNPDAAWTATGLPGKIRAVSAANKAAMQQLTGISEWIEPVVAIWAPFDQRVVKANGVTYVHGEQLAAWLTSQPSKLTDMQRRQRLAKALGAG